LLFGSVELARCPQVVAFVPAHHPVPASQRMQADLMQPIPAAYAPARGLAFGRAGSAFRATNVEAILPAGSPRPALLHANRQRGAEKLHTQPRPEAKFSDLSYAEPRQQLAKAQMPGPGTAPAQQTQGQEWVVLTTWQTQVSSPKAGETADYDTAAKPDGTASGAGSQPSAPASQITVTRLILQVYPANPTANPAANSAPAQQAPGSKPDSNTTPRSKPVSNRQAALPFYSGWLVFQL
jgi:hypothetical protein